jgi:hypothetical protein
MKDNPLAQAVREAKPQPFDMARLIQMVEEIHQAVVKQPQDDSGIITTQQSHS